MKVKIKKLHKSAIIPKYSKTGDAGLDLVAVNREFQPTNECFCITYKTGLSIEIPEGYVGLLFPRSSISKYHISLTNSVGVIDSGYRGDIMLKFKIDQDFYEKDGVLYDYIEHTILNIYEVGDKVGQLIIIPYPQIELIESEELSSTERGEGGYGSTGK